MRLADIDHCTGCTACKATCPRECIQMVPDQDGFLYPLIDEKKCVECGLCHNVCPVLKIAPEKSDGQAYAAINLDDKIRKASSSGGIFTLLCKWIIKYGGVVFGAAYDEHYNVYHCCINNEMDLARLRVAKYAQSDLCDTFQQVKEYLKIGQYVLFSGTPCQIAGLVNFLKQDYEKLILVDFVCHGVPAPAVWTQYILYRSKMDSSGSTPVSINLREKNTGWTGYSVRFLYADGSEYKNVNSKDAYIRSFVGNLDLRLSCYCCHFKGIKRISDFTLGDYWGVWSQEPGFHDDKGTSVVIVHTLKGQKIWDDIKPLIRYKALDINSCFNENTSALVSPKLPPLREEFMSCYRREDFTELVDRLAPIFFKHPENNSLIHRIIRKMGRKIQFRK